MWWRWAAGAAAVAGAREAVAMLGEDEGGLRLLGLVVGGWGCARADARRVWVWFDWEGIGAPDTCVVGGRWRRGLDNPPSPPFIPPPLLSILHL